MDGEDDGPSAEPSSSASPSPSPSPSLPPVPAVGEFAFDRSPSPLGTATPGSDAGGGAAGGNGEITLGWGGSEFGGSSKGNGTPRTPPVGVGGDAGGATTRLDDAADALRAWAATGDRIDRDADADADAAGGGGGGGSRVGRGRSRGGGDGDGRGGRREGSGRGRRGR